MLAGDDASNRSLDRREFMKAAVAIGGASALTTTASLYGIPEAAAAEPIGVADRSNRQHAWAAFLETDDRGLPIPPSHHVLLFLEYEGDGEPTPEDRTEMAGALRQLERAYEWGPDGLLFTVSYSRAYFDRFEDDLPPGIDLRDNEAVIEAVRAGEEDPTPEEYDVVIDLASDDGGLLLEAEEALWGFPGQDRDSIRGVEIEHDLEGIFEKPSDYPGRRTGFLGPDAVQENIDHEDVPEGAPLSMGFQSVFEDNIPSERNVSLLYDQTLNGAFEHPGAFAQGTIAHVSEITIDLDSWYELDKSDRIARMFSPHHDENAVGEVGTDLGRTSGMDDHDGMSMRDRTASTDIARQTQHDAEATDGGVVGHAQKLARARFDLESRESQSAGDGTLETTILRRDFNTTDRGGPGLHFISLMRFNGYFVYTRLAMNGVQFDTDGLIPPEDGADPFRIDHEEVDIDLENDGFLQFVTPERRGNFLMPPIELRALPPARAIRPKVTVGRGNRIDLASDEVTVKVHPSQGFRPFEALDTETVRFGHPDQVDPGNGVYPSVVSTNDGRGTGSERTRTVTGDAPDDRGTMFLTFPLEGTGLDEESDLIHLVGKTKDGTPIFTSETVTIESNG